MTYEELENDKYYSKFIAITDKLEELDIKGALEDIQELESIFIGTEIGDHPYFNQDIDFMKTIDKLYADAQKIADKFDDKFKKPIENIEKDINKMMDKYESILI